MVANRVSSRWRIGAGLVGLALALAAVGAATSTAATAADTGSPATAVAAAGLLGPTKVQADFNGDGYGDLAVVEATPADEDGEIPRVGSVVVLYGSASGLSTTGRQRILGTDLPGGGTGTFPSNPRALVAGDFNGDGASELAIGISGAKVGGTSAGLVYVVPGSTTGLKLGSTKVWTQNTKGVRGTAEVGDAFGSDLAAADFGGGTQDDLAIGVPYERTGPKGKVRAGIVQVLYGSAKGLTASGNQVWSQDTKGIAGIAESGDLFGNALVAGNFDGRHHADLAIAAPSETVHGGFRAGAVTVLYSSSRLTATGSQSWSQGSPGVAGVPQHKDGFGAHLAAGRFSNPGRDDLAIAVPGEKNATHDDFGIVQVLRGSSTGLTATGSVRITLPSVGGSGDLTHEFGATLLAADFGNNASADRYGDLLIGTRTNPDGTPLTTGYLLYGGPSGFSAAQDVAGHADIAAADFDSTGGSSSYADLAAVRLDGDDPTVDVSLGSSAGLSHAVAHSFTLADLIQPADASGHLLVGLSSAGSH